ncbi:hypothetical protein CDAR_547131 [Caerostris darwini]|uniref:Uncharacterized protein n=1 Tax=Caerostris darwini TaxID=1538125 RepID=A0AAV4PQG3_9ARAC|nr:hypothetical protein CDAR_547131 [Caerostris darwini]
MENHTNGFVDGNHTNGFVDEKHTNGFVDGNHTNGFVDEKHTNGFVDMNHTNGHIHTNAITCADGLKDHCDHCFQNRMASSAIMTMVASKVDGSCMGFFYMARKCETANKRNSSQKVVFPMGGLVTRTRNICKNARPTTD